MKDQNGVWYSNEIIVCNSNDIQISLVLIEESNKILAAVNTNFKVDSWF